MTMSLVFVCASIFSNILVTCTFPSSFVSQVHCHSCWRNCSCSLALTLDTLLPNLSAPESWASPFPGVLGAWAQFRFPHNSAMINIYKYRRYLRDSKFMVMYVEDSGVKILVFLYNPKDTLV